MEKNKKDNKKKGREDVKVALLKENKKNTSSYFINAFFEHLESFSSPEEVFLQINLPPHKLRKGFNPKFKSRLY